jgi:hypothetical protein
VRGLKGKKQIGILRFMVFTVAKKRLHSVVDNKVFRLHNVRDATEFGFTVMNNIAEFDSPVARKPSSLNQQIFLGGQ